MLLFVPKAINDPLPDMPTLPLAKLILACRAFMAPLAHTPCSKTTQLISLSYVAVSSLEQALVAEFHVRLCGAGVESANRFERRNKPPPPKGSRYSEPGRGCNPARP